MTNLIGLFLSFNTELAMYQSPPPDVSLAGFRLLLTLIQNINPVEKYTKNTVHFNIKAATIWKYTLDSLKVQSTLYCAL